MSLPFIDQLVDTTFCAAMSGQRHQEVVSSVITAGKEATHHGLCIPLPPLLDVAAILNAPYYITKVPNRYGDGALTENVLEYDTWLTDFCRKIQKRLGKSKANILDYLPLLLETWSRREKSLSQVNLIKWTMAYDNPLVDKTEEIYARWCETQRNICSEQWWWWDSKTRQDVDFITSGFSSRFSSRFGPTWVYEAFDHDAVSLYLKAENFELLPEQKKIIRQIKRKMVKETLPYAEFPEKQHPYYGSIPLIKLALLDDEYGDDAFINNKLPRFSNQQPEFQPPDLQIYLSYVCGYESVTQKLNGLSYASFIQCLVGLILDDWRNVVKRMRVRFNLHRAWPEPQAKIDLKHSDGAWKTAIKKGGNLPPTNLVSTLFKRCTYAGVCQTLTWQLERETRSAEEWYCGCILRGDIVELGFKSVQASQDLSDESSWIAERSNALPEQISHIIIVDEELRGCIYKVKRSNKPRKLLELSPVPNRYNMPNGPTAFDHSFISLRYQALGLLLTVLDKELR